MSINTVTVSGNLTRDPEVRTTQSGNDVMSFGIAVNDRRKNAQTGEWEDYANFFDCTMFGTNRVNGLAQYLHKGSHVTLSGKLRYSSWERDGQKRSKVEIFVNDIDFQGNYEDKSYQKPSQNCPKNSVNSQQKYQAPDSTPYYDDDIPF